MVFTDIFEENGPALTPFHGGFGLLTISGIKKPAYYAYQFLNQLGPTELKNPDPQSWVCRDTHGGAQILLWDLTHPTGGTNANQVYFRQPHPAPDQGTVTIKLTGVPPGKYQLQRWQVGYHHNDPCTTYLEMSSPGQLTRAQEQTLRNASRGEPETTEPLEIPASGEFTAELPLRENDVQLLKLDPQKTP